MTKRKPSKPRYLRDDNDGNWFGILFDEEAVDRPWLWADMVQHGAFLDAKQCRKLAAWLLKAADWMEAREK